MSQYAALMGSYGLETNAQEYVQESLSIRTDEIRLRFYLGKNTFGISTSGDVLYGPRLTADGSEGVWTFFYSTLGIKPVFADDDNQANYLANYVAWADGALYLEFLITRESYDGAADGQAQWWINGVSQGCALKARRG